MANHHGNEGVVYNGANAIAETTEWSITESAEIADDSALGDTWKTHKAGQNSWNGSLKCHWDETDTNGQVAMTVGASITLNLYPEGNQAGDKYFSGTVTITGIQYGGNMNSITSADIDFTGNGALSKPTAS